MIGNSFRQNSCLCGLSFLPPQSGDEEPILRSNGPWIPGPPLSRRRRGFFAAPLGMTEFGLGIDRLASFGVGYDTRLLYCMEL